MIIDKILKKLSTKGASLSRSQIRRLVSLGSLTGLSLVFALIAFQSCSQANHEVTITDTEPTATFTYEKTLDYLGDYRITFYCGCEGCCGSWANNRPVNPETGEPIVTGAYGYTLQPGLSCASSATLPAGTELQVEGFGRVVVQDKTADWIQEKYDGKIVDIYCNDHDQAAEWAAQVGDHAAVYRVDYKFTRGETNEAN